MAKFNKTHLSIDQANARGVVHRDYIAHCLRWSHVLKVINKGGFYKNARVLDVGCGKEMPMARALFTNRYAPLSYDGVDVNKLEMHAVFASDKVRFKPTLHGETDFLTLKLPHSPNCITSFEVLEHVPPGHARKMIERMYDLLDGSDENSVAIISTPCYDERVGAAANHPNEITYQALGAAFEDV
ncbi:MAG: class I SAM-dependent methyltransferase, partial [Euryarchaeota archaeon]|nr:class I SAM-dependent methyltransferase [Euryarchaeota archaeon]